LCTRGSDRALLDGPSTSPLGAGLFPLRYALSAGCIGVALVGGGAKADSLPCSVNVFVSDHASCIFQSEDIRCRDLASHLGAANVVKSCTIVVGGSERATLDIFGEALRSLQGGGFTNVRSASKFEVRAQAGIPFAEEFTNSTAVVLVRVIASTYPSQAASTYPSEASKRDYLLALVRSTAKLKVLRSWKGPYSAGASVAVATPQRLCTGQCIPYPFQVGEEVVVFIGDSAEPISVEPSSVINAAHVKDAIPVLDALAAKTGT